MCNKVKVFWTQMKENPGGSPNPRCDRGEQACIARHRGVASGASHPWPRRARVHRRRRGRENYQSLRIVSVAGGEFGVGAPLIQILSLTPICLWSLIRFSLNLVARSAAAAAAVVRPVAQSRPLPLQHPTSSHLLILGTCGNVCVCFTCDPEHRTLLRPAPKGQSLCAPDVSTFGRKRERQAAPQRNQVRVARAQALESRRRFFSWLIYRVNFNSVIFSLAAEYTFCAISSAIL